MNREQVSRGRRRRARFAGAAALAVLLALPAMGQDDQRLVLDDKDGRAPRNNEAELQEKSQALETVGKRLEEMRSAAQGLQGKASERLRAIEAARSALNEEMNAAELAKQTVEANLERVRNLNTLLKAFQEEKTSAAEDLERRLALLSVARMAFDETAADPGNPAGAVQAVAWRAAAQHAARRYVQAGEAIRRLDEELRQVQTVVVRQLSLGDRSGGKAGALQKDLAKAEQDLKDIDQQRREHEEGITLLRSRQATLQDLVSYLAEQERLRGLREGAGKGQSAAGQDDQRLIAEEAGTVAGSSPVTLPLSEPPASAPGEVPGLEVETGDSRAIHVAVGGEVLYAGPLRYYDQIVILNHHDGYFTVYAYLKRVFVAKGERLARGDVIGMSGVLPSGNGQHGARFEVRRGETSVDPASWFKTPPDVRRAVVEGLFDGE